MPIEEMPQVAAPEVPMFRHALILDGCDRHGKEKEASLHAATGIRACSF